MDNEVSTFVHTPDTHNPNQNEQTAAIFVRGGVKLRQFSPVNLVLEVNPFDLLTRLQPRKGLVHLA